ncbi:MAG: hypothetical protein KJ077_08480 [Anaerolineae bacterium]|nr:hypothetical protein [Anaerolineae bacterium]
MLFLPGRSRRKTYSDSTGTIMSGSLCQGGTHVWVEPFDVSPAGGSGSTFTGCICRVSRTRWC